MQLSFRSTITVLITTLFLAVVCAKPFKQPAHQQTSLMSAPSLQLRVILGGNNLSIHGQTTFDIFAKPVFSHDQAQVRYDGFTTIAQDDMEFTYMIVDGAGYVVTKFGSEKDVRCLPSVSPFDLILPALNRASVASSFALRGVAIECPGGSVVRTSFGGMDFSVCAFGESGATALGSFSRSKGLGSIDVTVSIEYLSSPIKSFTAPGLRGKHTKCPVVMKPTEVTPTTLSLLTGGATQSAAMRQLKTSAREATEGESCGCKSTPRPCIFFHGLGNPNEETELQEKPKWKKKRKVGDIHKHAPCCTTVKYAILNTVDYGWTNDTLQQKFCDHSLSMSATSDLNMRTIKDTIILTHSMGGLAMAGALANGRCSFSDSTSWVSMSAPMRGSMGADFSQNVCKGKIVSKIYSDCPASAARKSLSYQDEKYSTPELNAAYVAAQEAYRGNVTAAMCSTSFSGVLSTRYPWHVLAGTVIPHKSHNNDGLVEFDSCLGALDAASFGDSYHDRFYKPKLNHADTAFLTHDGFFSDSQKPFKWFQCLL